MPSREQRSLRVAQASGMVSMQADCSIPQAVLLMERRCLATDTTLDEIATSVIARELHFGG